MFCRSFSPEIDTGVNAHELVLDASLHRFDMRHSDQLNRLLGLVHMIDPLINSLLYVLRGSKLHCFCNILPESKRPRPSDSISTRPKWQPVASTVSRLRTLGSVIGLLSLHGDRYAGSVTANSTVWTLARTTRPARVFLTKRFAKLLFSTSADRVMIAGGVNAGEGRSC